MGADNLYQAPHDEDWWDTYRTQVEAAARSAASMWAGTSATAA